MDAVAWFLLSLRLWGVETVVPLPGGTSNLVLKQPLNTVPVADGDEEAKIRYEIMNTIPENWIPFIPSHVKDSNREVQLQRAALRGYWGQSG